MSLQLIVGGHYVSAFTAWGDLNWSLCWPGYSDELTFDVTQQASIFKKQAIVSLTWHGQPLWTGTLDEPVRGQQLRAAGLHRLGEDYAALDGSGNLSLKPQTSIDAAIARGLPWVRSIAWTDNNQALTTGSPSTVTQVADAAVAISAVGTGWGVFPDSRVAYLVRPTTPRLHVRPGGDGLGIAWDNYASTLIARYVDSTTHAYTTVSRVSASAAARWGYKEITLKDALNDGAEMTLAQAQAILDSKLASGRARPGWTSPIEVEFGGIVNNHQQAIDLRTIKPHEPVRIHGLTDDVGDLAGASYVDMPLARINHNPKDGTAVLTPAGLVDPMGDVLSGKTAA